MKRILRWPSPRVSLSVKLIGLLVLSLAALFSLFGYLNLRLQRHHAEELVLQSADRISDLIQRSTHYQMLRNDREALYHVIQTIGSEPGIRRIRIFNEEGRISFSTEPGEVNTYVDKRAEACYGCHAQAEPITKLDRPDRARIFTDARGGRVLGLIRPIENQPSCSAAACHAHPPERRILGVIDTDLSLATVDAQIAERQEQLVGFTAAVLALISAVSILFILTMVHRPVKELTAGTRRLAQGELDHRLTVRSNDELGALAASFNKMAADLAQAHEEVTSWARTLEERVEQKTRELKRAHEHLLQVEKMASVGKLAAVVAHEINNPLSGILTYAKLLRKWLERQPPPSTPAEAARREEFRGTLELVESESRRCGEIVRNLLTFSRTAPMNLEWADLNGVVRRVVRLVEHQMALANIQLNDDLAPGLPPVQCDPAQVEQVLLAMVMNAIEAMPHGGNLWLRSRALRDPPEVQLEVTDDGAGIPPDVLPHVFEPFFTTKEGAHGVGLGLAISHGIIERHLGRIEVESERGRGTKFVITLPVGAEREAAARSEAGVAETKAR
jgi:two-component system NtrC family sensor kinase